VTIEAFKVDRTAPLLVEGARFHTMDELVPRADWMVVLGDKIQRLGVGPAPAVNQRLSLTGRTVVPGFVDSHIHFSQTGLDSLLVDLSPATNLDEVRARLAAEARGKRNWIFARGYEEDALVDRGLLTRKLLDDWFPDRPVWIGRIDYHSSVINSAALRKLETPIGLRGMLVAEGEPTGILRSEAFQHARQRLARYFPHDTMNKAIKAATALCSAHGITAVQALEGGELFGDEGMTALLRREDLLPLDVTIFIQEKNPFLTTKLGFTHVGGCILIDGSIGSYTAALEEDYLNLPGQQGLLYERTRELGNFVSEAHQAGVQLAFHAIGPRAIGQLLGTYEKALAKSPRYDHRHRIEHFELATDEQIHRARDLGVLVAMQPTFELNWGGPKGMYASRIGEGWRKTNRLRTILDRGMRIAGGSDANVTPPNPLLGIHAAVNHPNPEQRVTPHEALRMMTLDAAFAGFNDRRHGSLSRGKDANFAVLARDPLKAKASTLRDIRVLETWYLGRRVYAAPAA